MAYYAIYLLRKMHTRAIRICRKRPRAAQKFRKRNFMRGIVEPSTVTLLQERELVHVGNSYGLPCRLTFLQTSVPSFPTFWLRPFSHKESPSATNGNKGTMSRGSTLLEKESPFPASFKMITESPWRIRPAPRWSSDVSCQAILSTYNPLCDISQRTFLINAFTCE